MATLFPTLKEEIRAVYPVPDEDLPGHGEEHSFETMAVWNRKGGVAKTTICHAMGFAFAFKGKRVLMVDADPQCDLSCLLLREWVKSNQPEEDTKNGIVDYSRFFDHQIPGRAMKNNLRTTLEPVVQVAGGGSPLGAWGPADVTKIELPADCNGALFLLPGHQRISEYEKKVTMAYASNLVIDGAAPGAWNKAIALTARKCGADIVIVDCNPHVGSLNMHIVLTSNYLFLPCTPDFHSHNAIKALPSVLRKWFVTRDTARNTLVHSEQLPPDLKIPGGNPRILGVSLMRFTHQGGNATKSFRHWINLIGTALRESSQEIHNTFAIAGMAGTAGEPDTWPSILAEVHDFCSLGALSHFYAIPVFALGTDLMVYWDKTRDRMTRLRGRAETDMVNRVSLFQEKFRDLLQNIGSKVVDGPFVVPFPAGSDDEQAPDVPDLAQQQPEHNIQGDINGPDLVQSQPGQVIQ